jgi:hypothetical protein
MQRISNSRTLSLLAQFGNKTENYIAATAEVLRRNYGGGGGNSIERLNEVCWETLCKSE